MRKRDMPVSNVFEEVDLILLQHQGGSDGMNRSIAPALVEETAFLVEEVEIVAIGLRTQEVEACDFKIRPLFHPQA